MSSQDGQNLSDRVMHPDKEVLVFFGGSVHLKVFSSSTTEELDVYLYMKNLDDPQLHW